MSNTADGLGAAHSVLVVGEAGIAELADIISAISAIRDVLSAVAARSAVGVVGNAFAVVQGQPVSINAVAIGIGYSDGRRRTAQTFDTLSFDITRVVVGVDGFEP